MSRNFEYAAAMFSFKILKKSKRSRARLGVIHTPHGDIETPAFVPVATRATIRTLDTSEVEDVGAQVLICNTFHLHVAPGEKLIKKAGGLHKYMRWNKPLMTDSGGFQVFSLGFGTDHGVGKMLRSEQDKKILEGSQPRSLTITAHGVRFRSPIDGKELFLGPKESIKVQEALGADIIFAFDECPSPLSSAEYMRRSIDTTHRWAAECLDAKKNHKQALYGIVQGGGSMEMRIESAQIIGAMNFDGFGFGGEFGYDKQSMKKVIGAVSDNLPENKPRHILGIGHPEDFSIIVAAGGDTFDCIAPTHYARRGTVFTSRGPSTSLRTSRLQINDRRFLKDINKPLDPSCTCDVCKTYSRSYICSLMRAHELTGMKLTTFHNLHYFNTQVRKQIKNGEL